MCSEFPYEFIIQGWENANRDYKQLQQLYKRLCKCRKQQKAGGREQGSNLEEQYQWIVAFQKGAGPFGKAEEKL